MGTEDDFFISDEKRSGFVATGDGGSGDLYPRTNFGHRTWTWFIVPSTHGTRASICWWR